MHSKAPQLRVMPAACSSQGWIASPDAPVKFIFDGDPVDPDETPEGLDLEGEEMIEVRF
jgi:hypothetical protein